ncbi:MAG: hypothetical protein Ct9H300mP1_35630 [Planctomycetaceae bacterium]|nr:MAG: hypothetical protein Ct9H300mP1_35630 [Planctomycetaceae bacterium]
MPAQWLGRFTRAYGELVSSWQKQARLVVLVTPSPFEAPPNRLIPDLSLRNDDLALYVQAISKLAADRGLVLVDLFPGHERIDRQRDAHQAIGPGPCAHSIASQLGSSFPKRRFSTVAAAVVEKHRLWYDYWRPANWKLLYGDDSRRQFTRGEPTTSPSARNGRNCSR